MIIGVDAGALAITDERLKVGVWRTSYNLLRELSKLDRKNDYRLYSFRPLDEGLVKSFGGRMTNRVLRPLPGWFTLRLPIELRLNPVDIFLGLSQAIPFSAPKKSLGFVYDLGFLHYPQAYRGTLRQLKRHTEELVRRASQIVAISKTTATDIVKTYHYPSKNITVAYPGVAAQFTSVGAKYTGKNPYFLFVGALKRGKNIPAAIRAFAKFLNQTKKPYDFLIIGGNYWEDDRIKQTIEELHLGKRVKLLGHAADSELPKFYRGATALVVPSLWEGFCLPAVEAMASGCPVVASTQGSLPEIVGDAGISVSPMDVEAITRAMVEFTQNLPRRKVAVAKGLARRKLFSWRKMAETVAKLYEA